MDPNPALSIVTPTLREAPNICDLVKDIHLALRSSIPEWELIVVDDDSKDGIVEKCQRLRGQGMPVRLRVRKNESGLATAVVEGFKLARAPIIAVMDADLSHRGEDIPKLYRAVCEGAEMAIGSRYIEGGGTDDRWTVYRLLNSQLASLMAKPLVRISDPMSGFFAIPGRLLERADRLSPVGYKIGLEIIVKCRPKHIKEIPIHFRTRVLGKSKLSFKQQLLYISHLLALYKHRWEFRNTTH